MSRLPAARWWSVRPASNRKPVTYRCPFCDRNVVALSEHMLIWPEDDRSRRRHAHTQCVLRARRRGEIVMRSEYLRATRGPWLRSLVAWWRARGGT